MYGHILCIIIYWYLRDATWLDFFVSFFGSYFLKFKNVKNVKKRKTTKLVFIFKYMHSLS